MSNPDTFVEPRKRYSVEGRMFSIHFVADDSSRVYSCVTDKEYPAHIAFALLDEMQTKFLTKVCITPHYCYRTGSSSSSRGTGTPPVFSVSPG